MLKRTRNRQKSQDILAIHWLTVVGNECVQFFNCLFLKPVSFHGFLAFRINRGTLAICPHMTETLDAVRNHQEWSGIISKNMLFFQRHLARTTGRWKDPPKKNAVNELQDELMTVRLREAETQAELKETKQRMMEVETQVCHWTLGCVNWAGCCKFGVKW